MQDFIINKDYIGLQIPENLRKTWVFSRVVDIFYAAISSDTPSGSKISQYYNDMEYYSTNFANLSVEMKRAKLKDNGYGFLLDVFGSGEQSLNNLSNFLNLIKLLKCKTEGFTLILDTLGLNYKFSTWDESDYKGEVFTAKLEISLSLEGGQAASDFVSKLQNIARNYLAPLVIIEYNIVEELLDGTENTFNNYFSSGFIDVQMYPTFEITGSL